jgi:hypothetical protein
MAHTNVADAHREIAARHPFHNSTGSLRGEVTVPHKTWIGTGHLPREYRGAVLAADYVVFSYATPIGWHVPGQGWTVPDVKYSVTTSRHQGQVRRAAR